jgi:hypothetical protein
MVDTHIRGCAVCRKDQNRPCPTGARLLLEAVKSARPPLVAEIREIRRQAETAKTRIDESIAELSKLF